jgi:hypothetical protein
MYDEACRDSHKHPQNKGHSLVSPFVVVVLVWMATTLSLSLFLLVTAPVATAAPATYHVAPNADCAATPCYATLQSAIDAAQPGDEIRVAQGVYTATTAFEYDLGGWTQTITQAMFIDKSLTVRGGYTITDWTSAHPISYPTVIDPQGRGRGGVIGAPDVGTLITVTLQGLAITNGYSEGGSGLYIDGASAIISGCHIHHNTAGWWAANDKRSSGSHRVLGNSLADGLYFAGHTLTLMHNRIENNAGSGHSVVVDMGFPSLLGNLIVSNINGLLLLNNRATLVNNVIADNAEVGLTVVGGKVQAWHTTLAENDNIGMSVHSSGQGGAHLVMTNTIIAGPATGVRVTGVEFDPSIVQLTATLWDNVTDTHTVDAGGLVTRTRDRQGDPAFVGSGGYHLTAGSPARNQGWPTDVRYDIDGEPRDPLPDLGADEVFDPGSIRQVYVPLILR